MAGWVPRADWSAITAFVESGAPLQSHSDGAHKRSRSEAEAGGEGAGEGEVASDDDDDIDLDLTNRTDCDVPAVGASSPAPLHDCIVEAAAAGDNSPSTSIQL